MLRALTPYTAVQQHGDLGRCVPVEYACTCHCVSAYYWSIHFKRVIPYSPWLARYESPHLHGYFSIIVGVKQQVPFIIGLGSSQTTALSRLYTSITFSSVTTSLLFLYLFIHFSFHSPWVPKLAFSYPRKIEFLYLLYCTFIIGFMLLLL